MFKIENKIKPSIDQIKDDKENFFSKVFYKKTLLRSKINTIKDLIYIEQLSGVYTKELEERQAVFEGLVNDANGALKDDLKKFFDSLDKEEILNLFRNATLSPANKLTCATIKGAIEGNGMIYNRLFEHILIDAINIDKEYIFNKVKDFSELINFNKEMNPDYYSDDEDEFVVWIKNYIEEEHQVELIEHYLETKNTPKSQASISMYAQSFLGRLKNIETGVLKKAKFDEIIDILSRNMKIY